MMSPDLQRIKHIRDYCIDTIARYGKMNQSVIWETATVDIPALLQFCEELLAQ